MKKIIFTIVALISAFVTIAQNKNTIYIDVILPKNSKDTLTLQYQNNGWALSALETIKLVDSLSNNHFEIHPNIKDKYFYLTIGGKNRYLFINYLAEAGDSIQIYVDKENLIFRGKGYEKYKCIYDMEKISNTFPYPNIIQNYNTINGEIVKDSLYYTNYVPDATSCIKRIYSSTKCSQEVLNWYKSQISTDIYYVLLGNLIAKAEIKILNYFIQHFNGFKKEADYTQKRNIQDSLITIYVSRNAYNFSKLPDSLLAYSYEYLEYISNKYQLNDNKFISSIAEYSSKIYGLQGIIDNYNGFLRDKVITQYLVKNFGEIPNISEQIDQALKFVNDSNCRDLLIDLRKTNSKGSKAYNFQLPDKNGKIRTLEEFKGKIILMDFWFTGCSGCRVMAENLKPVINYFKNNKNITFISIGADDDIYTWKNSVEKEIYTNKYSVDLFTQGKGVDHPIIKNFKVMSYPTLILIGKDGKIITTSVIKPMDLNGQKDLIKFIENYI